MYCRNCGKEIDPNAAVCLSCGVKNGTGKSFCHNCGETTNPEQVICTKCGYSLKGGGVSGSSVAAGGQKMHRSRNGKILGGVCVGLAESFGWDSSLAWLFRLGFFFISWLFGIGLIIYIIFCLSLKYDD